MSMEIPCKHFFYNNSFVDSCNSGFYISVLTYMYLRIIQVCKIIQTFFTVIFPRYILTFNAMHKRACNTSPPVYYT